MYSVIRNRNALRRGALALAVLTAAVFAVGLHPEATAAQSPVIAAGGPYQAYVGQAIGFTGTVDTVSVASATWTFSDGTSLAGLSVLRAFYAPGTYAATLTVTDLYGGSSSATTTVTIYPSSALTVILTPATLISGIPLQSLIGSVVQLANGAILINGRLFPVLSSSICADPNYVLTPFCQNL